MSEHFPTFARMRRIASRTPVLGRVVALERLLLRLALYVVLVASGLQFAFVRSGQALRPAPPSMSPLLRSAMSDVDDPGGGAVFRMMVAVTNFIGIDVESCLLLAVLSLCGLAASASRPGERAIVAPAINASPHEVPEPIPRRHPLDPDPDDPPPRPLWNRRSPPST